MHYGLIYLSSALTYLYPFPSATFEFGAYIFKGDVYVLFAQYFIDLTKMAKHIFNSQESKAALEAD